MGLFDEIIAHLELEKELGTRTVEIDRALLLPPAPPAPPVPPVPKPSPTAAVAAPKSSSATGSSPAAESTEPAMPSRRNERTAPPRKPESSPVAIAFLTAGDLSPSGEELLAKMMSATKLPPDRVTRVKNPPFSGGAKVAVVMGSDALRAYAPGVRAGLGAWTTLGATPAVVTYSPDRLLRFFANDAAKLREGKVAVWNAIKGALAKGGT